LDVTYLVLITDGGMLGEEI